MKKFTESIHVNNEKSLADALKEQYGLIILEDDVADKIRKSLKKYRAKQKIQTLSGWGLFFGLWFWPLFVASLATSFITSDDLSNYKVDITNSDQITLIHKKRKKCI